MFALVRLLLPAGMSLPWCNFMYEKYNALTFVFFFTVCMKLFMFLFRAVLEKCLTNKKSSILLLCYKGGK